VQILQLRNRIKELEEEEEDPLGCHRRKIKTTRDGPVARVSLKRVSLSAVFAAKTLAPHICLFFFLFYLVFIVPKVLFVAVTTSFAIPPKAQNLFFFFSILSSGFPEPPSRGYTICTEGRNAT
jgi:hypothetical protein